MNIFVSLDPSVKKLIGWKMGDDEEKWALKAVESLVKKLRKQKMQHNASNGQAGGGCGCVEDLEFALAHPGKQTSAKERERKERRDVYIFRLLQQMRDNSSLVGRTSSSNTFICFRVWQSNLRCRIEKVFLMSFIVGCGVGPTFNPITS